MQTRTRARKKRTQLATVANAKGRIDVMCYRVAEKLMQRFESQYQLVGVCENLLPIVEQAITQFAPDYNVLPAEADAIIGVLRRNARRL